MATPAEWLAGDRDYYQGLEILKQHGLSAFMADLLSSGPDAYNTPKVLSKIQDLVKNQPDENLPMPAAEKQKPAAMIIQPETTYRPDNNLEKKLRIEVQIKQLWKEIAHLHAQQSILPEGEQLYQVTRDLLIKNVKRQELWDHLHYFEANGEWFDELPENQEKPYDLEQDIKNAMSRRAKAKSKLKKPQPHAKKQYYEGKVAVIDKEIENLIAKRDVA